jgi:hypothetical protein
MKALPGCNNPIPGNNACIVGPDNLNMELDSSTNQIVPFSSDLRLLTISPAQTRIRIVSDSSGLPVTTIGDNEFVPELGQFYQILVKKIEWAHAYLSEHRNRPLAASDSFTTNGATISLDSLNSLSDLPHSPLPIFMLWF